VVWTGLRCELQSINYINGPSINSFIFKSYLNVRMCRLWLYFSVCCVLLAIEGPQEHSRTSCLDTRSTQRFALTRRPTCSGTGAGWNEANGFWMPSGHGLSLITIYPLAVLLI
jgi:hypothetical protein